MLEHRLLDSIDKSCFFSSSYVVSKFIFLTIYISNNASITGSGALGGTVNLNTLDISKFEGTSIEKARHTLKVRPELKEMDSKSNGFGLDTV